MSDTLCIAAKCKMLDGKPGIVLCADKRVETDTTGSENVFKFEKLQAERWVCTIAGSVERARRITVRYREMLADTTITASNAFRTFSTPALAQRREYVEELTQRKHSVSYDHFLARKANFSEATFRETEREIAELELGCALVIAGVIENECCMWDTPEKTWTEYEPAIYTVDNSAHVASHDNFVCIGSGQYNADAMLNFRRQHKGMTLIQTLYHVFEAKTFAETAPGVGKDTDLAWIDGSYLYWKFMNEAGLDYMKSMFGAYGLKPTSNLVPQDTSFPYSCYWADREQMSGL